jgi:hypothetical protein
MFTPDFFYGFTCTFIGTHPLIEELKLATSLWVLIVDPEPSHLVIALGLVLVDQVSQIVEPNVNDGARVGYKQASFWEADGTGSTFSGSVQDAGLDLVWGRVGEKIPTPWDPVVDDE